MDVIYIRSICQPLNIYSIVDLTAGNFTNKTRNFIRNKNILPNEWGNALMRQWIKYPPSTPSLVQMDVRGARTVSAQP